MQITATTSLPLEGLRNETSRGRRADSTFRTVALIAGSLVLAILAAIAISTTREAWPAFTHEGLSYFFGTTWNPSAGQFGALPFIYGTLVVSVIALLFGVPISIGIALFTNEVAPRRMRSAVITVIDLLAAIPSVVFGLWGVLVIAPNIEPLYDRISSAVDGIPVLNTLFAEGIGGYGYLTAGMILALMIIPIVTAVTREVFTTVPRNDKEGALALGATRWEMIRGVIFPHSTGGMVGAVMLGLGRAMGETILVVLVIGGNAKIYESLFGPGDAMPSAIARNLGESASTPYFQEALIGLGVTLFVITILVNMGARWVVSAVNARTRGQR